MIQGQDERGFTTVAKLKKLFIRGGRELAHKRSMTQSERTQCHESELPDVKRSF